MPETKTAFKEVLPKQGALYTEEATNFVLCKPKLLPMKSVTLEKMEKMQKEAQEKVKEMEKGAQMQAESMFTGPERDFDS